jgi:hypothetical protein
VQPVSVVVSAAPAEREVTGSGGEWRLGRPDLLGNLQVLFEAGRLVVAGGPEGSDAAALRDKFVQQLQTVTLRVASIAENDPEALRNAPQDDLVFAVALAAWRASRHVPAPPAAADAWARKLDDHYKKANKAII